MKIVRHGSWVSCVVLGAALGLPGCFTVGDDDSGEGGEAGEQGSGGKGASSGSGGSASGGSGGSASGSGGLCIATGDVCEANGDCCSFSDTLMGFCVAGTCYDGCGVDSDCPTHCCAALQGGGSACAPAEVCCVDDGRACTSNAECCSSLAGAGYCITDTGLCHPTCVTNSDCTSGCCAPIDAGESVCAEASFCGGG